MEIKVGEYVRTNQGYIAKLEDIDKEFMYFDNVIMCYYEETKVLPINEKMLDETFLKAEDYITKHSFNIAEILEEDDYVNGNKVVKQVSEEDKEPYLVVVVSSKMIKEPLFDYITNNRIKSIVTKEQFKAMEYEVK